MHSPAGPRLFVAALLLALLAACSLTPPLPPAPNQPALAEPTMLKRQLSFERDDRREAQTLIALIRLDGTALRAALLTPYGQRLVTLVDDDDGSRYVAGDVPLAEIEQRLPPAEWLAARLQWCLWPAAALREAFAGTSWRLTLSEGAREISHRGQLIARISPADSQAGKREPVLLDDRQGQYRLRITPLKDSP
ncbi:DUF3261 domain-containing protein [Halomonas sp. HP20-15]|uniref:DUF3261 domain-containing protein n=1 Tax=Halomonas sp. HP20-15 TaxID=3085901 RepID=UPI00298170E9|nr:DUF3261 domain-containing protein [Halomonas sp. HP20-15]MDW5377464.1 DUF3261 domain-containing protein [Halomonas sp. HP20-15]